MTIRSNILLAFAARMGAAWGSAQEPDFQALPQTAITPGDDDASIDTYGVVHCEMPVTVQVYDELGASPAGVHAETLLGNLISTATGTDTTLGGLCQSIEYTGGGPDYPDADSDVVGAHADFLIRYQFLEGSPSTAPTI